jgi:hypothetical protein
VLGLAQPRDGRDRGATPGGDDHGQPRLEQPLADRNAPLAVEAAAAAHERHVPLLEPGELDGIVEVVDHLVAPRQHGLDVERAAHRLAHTGHTRCLGEQLARSQQRLRGHTGVVRALTADQVLLDDRDIQPRLTEAASGHLTGGAGADHNDIELFSHDTHSIRLR